MWGRKKEIPDLIDYNLLLQINNSRFSSTLATDGSHKNWAMWDAAETLRATEFRFPLLTPCFPLTLILPLRAEQRIKARAGRCRRQLSVAALLMSTAFRESFSISTYGGTRTCIILFTACGQRRYIASFLWWEYLHDW